MYLVVVGMFQFKHIVFILAGWLPVISLAAEKPNIIIFLVDDMGLMDTSVPFALDEKGQPFKYPLNKFYRTPAMAKLARNGVRFAHFYANSVCSPSRVSLLNGQYSARHHTTQWINPTERNAGPEGWGWEGGKPSDITLQGTLKKGGYQTIHVGKAHLGPFGQVGEDPLKLGFDVNIGGAAIGRPATYYGSKNFGEGSVRAVPHLEEYHGTNTFLTEALTIEAMKALTKASEEDQPFFLHMSHYAVHGPFESDPRFAKHYAKSDQPEALKAFATLVEGMDKSLNSLVKHLGKIGEAENTLIIFLGDNGSDAPFSKDVLTVESSAPYRGKKGTHYEGGMRAPLIVSWAKPNPKSELQKKYPIKRGIVTDSFVTICDIMPSILKAVDIEAPEGHVMDGQDLSRYFASHRGKHNQEFLMHFPHQHRSSNFTVFRDGEWKLIKHYDSAAPEAFELFFLEEDPYERKNLANTNPSKREVLHQKMLNRLENCHAQFFDPEP